MTSHLPRPWTFDDDQFLRMRWRLADLKAVARDLRRTPQETSERALRLGLGEGADGPGSRRNRLWTKEQDDLLRGLWETCDVRRISREVGRTQTATRDRAHRLGLRCCPSGSGSQRDAKSDPGSA